MTFSTSFIKLKERAVRDERFRPFDEHVQEYAKREQRREHAGPDDKMSDIFAEHVELATHEMPRKREVSM
jgi:hypothetical protein